VAQHLSWCRRAESQQSPLSSRQKPNCSTQCQMVVHVVRRLMRQSPETNMIDFISLRNLTVMSDWVETHLRHNGSHFSRRNLILVIFASDIQLNYAEEVSRGFHRAEGAVAIGAGRGGRGRRGGMHAAQQGSPLKSRRADRSGATPARDDSSTIS
jgi:hypothetical protein